jgi:DNA topoisomerase-3
MDQFTRSSACRMSTIVGYFTNDPNQLKPCGICDICFPNYSSLGIRQKLSDEDLKRCRIILETLADYPQVAKGKLWKEMPGGWQQGEFDALLACLEQYGMIKIKREQFQKKDHLIHFQKITLLSPPSVSLQELSRIYPGKAKASKSPRALGPKKAALIPANLNKS